jgi:uncharacterized membrane protein
MEPDGTLFSYRGRGFADRYDHAAVEFADRLSVLAEREKLNARTVLGTVAVVGGTIAIILGR